MRRADGHDAALQAIAWLAVPTLGDWCLIDVLQPEGGLRRVAVAHAAPAEASVARQVGQYAMALKAASPAHQALQGQSLRMEAAEASFWSVASNEEHLQTLRSLGPRAFMLVPLEVRGRPIGLIAFVSTRSRPRYSEEDLQCGQEFAARVSVALENARLHEEVRSAQAQALKAVDRTSRLQAVTAALAGALTQEEVVEIAVQQGISALGAMAGSMCLFAEDADTLLIRSIGYSNDVTRTWRRVPRSAAFPLADVVRSLEPLFLRDAAERLARYPHLRQLIQENGPGGMAAIPLVHAQRALGAIGLNFAQPTRFDAEDREFILTLAGLCTQALERARLYEAERQARQRLELLSEASRVLSLTLDYETTLVNAAKLAMPLLADFCFFDVVEDDGSVRRIARSHQNAKNQALLEQTRWARAEHTDLNVCALSSGRSGFHPRVDEAWMRRTAVAPAHYALMRELDFCSLLTVPLRIEERLTGALTLAFAESRRHHGLADLTLAEELARRVALAVENARLFRSAQQAIAQRDEFLSIASHELNTPLTTLKLQMDLLRHKQSPDLAENPRLTASARQVDRLAQLVKTLLDVSRLTARRLELEPEEVDLVELAREVVTRQTPEASLAGSTFHVEAAEAVYVQADRLRLDQALSNLVSNAVKYGAGGPIHVRVESSQTLARVSVRDHGIGIPPEHQTRIFDRFERAVSSRNFGGFGLGLWIVRQIADAHGGAVRLQSEPGQGATFTLELPRRAG